MKTHKRPHLPGDRPLPLRAHHLLLHKYYLANFVYAKKGEARRGELIAEKVVAISRAETGEGGESRDTEKNRHLSRHSGSNPIFARTIVLLSPQVYLFLLLDQLHPPLLLLLLLDDHHVYFSCHSLQILPLFQSWQALRNLRS